MIVAVMAVVLVAGCTEKLESSSGCPLLCPDESIALRDTVLDAVSFDSTVTGLPPIGNETYLVLATHGDSIDTRVIVRYDTIAQTFSHNGLDTAITRVDSAYVRLTLTRDTLHLPTAPVTIELYDVDTPATDTVAAILLPLFNPSRLIGSSTFAPESVTDTLRVGISNAAVLQRIANGTRLRVGMRIVSAKPAELLIQSTLSGTAPTLSFRVSPDTAVARLAISPASLTPPDSSFLTTALSDYVIVAAGNTSTPSTLLSAGGIPVRRSFLQFNLPSDIVDSSTVVRATLLLTQRPTPKGARAGDTVNVFPVAIVAAPTVTNVFTALGFTTALGTLGLNATRTTPADSGVKQIEIVSLLRAWRGISPTASARVMALQSADENQTSGEINFFSTHAAPSLRPRLRITYVPRAAFGIP